MSKTQKFLQLENELKPYREVLKRASEAMRDNEVSNYPIFVAHKNELEVGLVLIDKNMKGFKWTINVSSLEEFVAKSIVHPEKIEDFKKVFKDPDSHICFFVLSELGAQFVYIPIENISE